jgi:hypothetical protein
MTKPAVTAHGDWCVSVVTALVSRVATWGVLTDGVDLGEKIMGLCLVHTYQDTGSTFVLPFERLLTF